MHGAWKVEFRLHTGRALMGVPVFLPDDPAIPAQEVPARAGFERPFVRDKDILQREAREGAAGLTLLGYGTVLAITLSILALNAWALVRLATVNEDADRERFRRTPTAPPARRSRRAASSASRAPAIIRSRRTRSAS